MAMTTRTKAVLLTVGFGVLGFLLQGQGPIGRLLWPPAEMPVEPTPAQMLGFVGYSLFEALAFGAGLAFLALGYPTVRRVAPSASWARTAHLAVVFLLSNWVVHDALHMHVGFDLGGLLAIEWGFHGSLIAVGAVLVAFVAAVANRLRTAPQSVPAPRATSTAVVTKG